MKCQRSAILQQFEKPETDSFGLSEVEKRKLLPAARLSPDSRQGSGQAKQLLNLRVFYKMFRLVCV